MSRHGVVVRSAPRVAVGALPYGSQSHVRRLVLCVILSLFVISMLAAYSSSAKAAGAPAPAGFPASTLAGEAGKATQDGVAAWSCRGVYHVVGRGETIYSIARRYGTTAYRIAVCNGLASYTVYVGQTLLVPTARS